MYEMTLVNRKNGRHYLCVEVESLPEDRPYPTYARVQLDDPYFHFWVGAVLASLERRGLVYSERIRHDHDATATLYRLA